MSTEAFALDHYQRLGSVYIICFLQIYLITRVSYVYFHVVYPDEWIEFDY